MADVVIGEGALGEDLLVGGEALGEGGGGGGGEVPAQTLADLLAWPARETIVLALLEPSVTLSVFTLTSGMSHTYEVPCPAFEPFHNGWPSGVYRPVVGVRENASDLAGQTSVAAVEATAGSYFWDEATETLYVHSSTGADPDTFVVYQAFVRLHLATTGIVLNPNDDPEAGIYFWPWLTGASPTSSQAMGRDLFGIRITSGGESQATNGHAFWHRVMAPDGVWNWKNKRVRFLLGGRFRGYDLPYAAYEPFATMLVDDVACDEEQASWVLRPPDRVTDQQIPKTPLFEGQWPNMDPAVRGRHIPIGYGRATLPALLVDTTIDEGRYLIADSAFQTLDAVHEVWAVAKANGARTSLTLSTDYTVDLTACTVTIVNATYLAADYTIVVDVTGIPLVTFADIVLDLLQRFCGVQDEDLDLDSFTQAAQDAPEELSVWITEPRQITSILSSSEQDQPSLERSVLGLLRYTAGGQLQVKIRSAVQTTTTTALQKADFQSFTPQPTLESAFWSTQVFYGQNLETGGWPVAEATDPRARYLLETEEGATLYTFLTDAGDAETLAQRFQLIAGGVRQFIPFVERSAKLYAAVVGDVVTVSYNPAPTVSGMFDEDPLILAEIERRIAPVPEVRGVFRDTRGLGNLGFAIAPDDAPDDWTSASIAERGAYGFAADDDGFIVPGDATTKDIKVAA